MADYGELTPQSVQTLIDNRALAVLPWGALEWHGEHLPMGLDGAIAEAFARLLCERTKGVLLPTQWNPMTTLPHPNSIDIDTATFRTLVDRWLERLGQMGFDRVAIISGHYAQGQMVELYEASIRALRRGQHVFSAPPLEPLDDPDLLDHAGRYEASVFLHFGFKGANFGALPETLDAKRDAVLGQDPRLGNSEEGRELVQRALDAWCDWIDSPGDLEGHYRLAIEQYSDYKAKFFRESWEQAIEDWWNSK